MYRPPLHGITRHRDADIACRIYNSIRLRIKSHGIHQYARHDVSARYCAVPIWCARNHSITRNKGLIASQVYTWISRAPSAGNITSVKRRASSVSTKSHPTAGINGARGRHFQLPVSRRRRCQDEYPDTSTFNRKLSLK